jgi:DNA-binding transcriptional LysR family regulator
VTGHDLRPSGELRITTNDTLLVHLLSEVLAAFRRAYPEITLDVVVANHPLNLSKRDADVALRATDRPIETLVGRRLAGIGWAIYAPASLVDGKRDADLATRDHNWVGFGDNLASIKPAKWLKQHVDPQRIVYKVNTVLGLAEAVAAGIGVALLPCFIAAITPGVERLSPPDGIRVVAAHPSGSASHCACARVHGFCGRRDRKAPQDDRRRRLTSLTNRNRRIR